MCTQEMINLHMGQGLDIWWHNGKKEPNVQEYLQARDLTHSRISKKKKNIHKCTADLCADVCIQDGHSGASQLQDERPHCWRHSSPGTASASLSVCVCLSLELVSTRNVYVLW
jgi:hypothetical protein